MKRHEKPYGCTFDGCKGRFGSKNDWKRHENSQHFLLEVWKCCEPKSHGTPETCGKVYHRPEQFRIHLSQAHRLLADATEQKLEVCRVGRNCDARFWCGFCEKIIEVTRSGLPAWSERFNHIDDHFSGRNGLDKKTIDEWKSVDPSAPAANAEGSDSDECSSPPPPVMAVKASTHTSRRHHNGRAGSKRKADDGEDGRQGMKRRKEMLQVVKCVSINPFHPNSVTCSNRITSVNATRVTCGRRVPSVLAARVSICCVRTANEKRCLRSSQREFCIPISTLAFLLRHESCIDSTIVYPAESRSRSSVNFDRTFRTRRLPGTFWPLV